MEKTELVSIVQKSGLFSLYQDDHKGFEFFANLAAANERNKYIEVKAELIEAVQRLLPLAKVAAEDNSVRWHEDEDIVFALAAIAKAAGTDPEKLD